MIGNVRWNLWFSLAGTLLAFMFSWLNNPLSTALIRSLYCFVALFLLLFVVRFFLGSVANITLPDEQAKELTEGQEGAVGANVDLSTPDETEQIQEALKQSLTEKQNVSSTELNTEGSASSAADALFTPLKPERLVTTSDDQTAEELARAVRQMSELEGR